MNAGFIKFFNPLLTEKVITMRKSIVAAIVLSALSASSFAADVNWNDVKLDDGSNAINPYQSITNHQVSQNSGNILHQQGEINGLKNDQQVIENVVVHQDKRITALEGASSTFVTKPDFNAYKANQAQRDATQDSNFIKDQVRQDNERKADLVAQDKRDNGQDLTISTKVDQNKYDADLKAQLSTDVNQDKAISDESKAREQGDKLLNRRVDNNDAKISVVQGEVQQNRSDIAANKSAITSETTRATGAEKALDSRINTETSGRIAADTQLQKNIDTKVDTTRFVADQKRQDDQRNVDVAAQNKRDAGQDVVINNNTKETQRLEAVKADRSELQSQSAVINQHTTQINSNTQRISHNEQRITKNEQDIKEVRKSVKHVGAMATASANLHYNRSENGYAVAVGEYEGATAIAGGVQFNISTNTAATVQASFDGEGTGVSVGFHGSW